MKLFIAAVLVAFAAAKLSSTELRDSITNPADLPAFKSGQQYRYRFDSQIASGIAEITHQKALTRIQAEANVYFQSERLMNIQLENIRIGAANGRMIQEPSRMHPFAIVEQKQIEPEQLAKLQLPFQVSYVDGLVERISFHSDDDNWSKNLKRSVVSMLQVNLKAKNLSEEQQQEVKAQDPKWKELTPRAFTAQETTIEGECDTIYVINKLENAPSTDVDFFNVTKTINFEKCEKLADVHYGPQVEQRIRSEWQEPSLAQEANQQLRRSTIVRHFVVGTPEKFSIKRVESVSQYVFKTFNAEQETRMMSVVVNELTCIEAPKTVRNKPSKPSDSQDESLLYSNDYDRDVKRFYMYGDDEYTEGKTPFAKIQNKQKLIADLLRQIKKSTEDKKIGVEAESSVLLPRLVELLRTCSVQELKEILSRADQKAEDILVDSLAIAATRNTLQVLVDMIQNNKINTPKAIQSLKALREVPAPSDKQVHILTKLCQSDKVQESEPLRQVCWLTVGSLMGEFCGTSKQNGYVINKNEKMCERHITDKFLQIFKEELKDANTRYEKILVLKALGNAGLKESIPTLKKTIYDQKEDPLVRQQAIDSLRRLRMELPHRIQEILMPVFKNQQELTEVRLQALSLLIQTIPERACIDQIATVLMKERSKNVRSFVYDIMKSYAQSPLVDEQQIAKQLKAIVKLSGINEKEEERLRSSRAHHIPLYSNEQQEGVFLNFESMFSSDNAFSKKAAAGLDTFLNGVFEKNALEVDVQQEDVERWYQKMYDAWFSSSSNGRTSRRSETELSSIFSSLDMKSRRESQSRRDRKYQTPFGLLSIRHRDVDVAMLPLEEETMPEVLQKLIIQGQKPSIRDFSGPLSWLNGQTFQMNTAWNFYERLTKIPTTAGIPLKFTLSMPALASIEGSGKLRNGGVAIKIQPSIAISQIKKMETSFPVVNSGVENVVSVEINIPVDGEVMVEGSNSEKKSIRLTMNVPEENKRLVGFHSLPVTFIRDFDKETRVHKQAQVKAIHNELMTQRDWQMDKVVGQEIFGFPVHLNGHVHTPAKLSYLSLFDALMTSENHIHVEFKPEPETPRQVELTLEGETFRRLSTNLRPEFTELSNSFSQELQEEYEFVQQGSQDQSQQKAVERFVKNYKPRNMYQHKLEATLKTIGGRMEKSGKLEIESTCDDRFGYCKTTVQVQRDPLFEGERREWKLNSEIRTAIPEFSVDYEQYQQKKEQKNQKFICAIDTKWGTDAQQNVNIRVNGEQVRTQEWLQTEETEVTKRNNPELREKSAFLNKYDVVAEYKLRPEIKAVVSRAFDYFKLANFWNTQTESVHKSNKNKRSEPELLQALVVIDPISREHVNMTVKTMTEKVRINSLIAPTKVAPFALIRHPSQSVNSHLQLWSSLKHSAKDSASSAQECSIDGRQVSTFDQVVFKAPITKCYTVLSKDCNPDSRFAVMMKKVNGEDKKLKLVDRNTIIEVEPTRNDEFKIRVNGDSVEESQYQDYGIAQLDNMVSIKADDVQVRFNGRQAWVQISEQYKNQQCGVCGHYDDDEEREFVQGNNEATSDLRQYFKSYTLKDGECDEEYESEVRRHEFETVDSSKEWGREQSSRSDEDDFQEPIKKVQILEYNHKICFSKKTVAECPRNTYSGQEKKDVKVQFACLSRDDVKTRRLIRQLKLRPEEVEQEVIELNMSFVETIKAPTKCIEF